MDTRQQIKDILAKRATLGPRATIEAICEIRSPIARSARNRYGELREYHSRQGALDALAEEWGVA